MKITRNLVAGGLIGLSALVGSGCDQHQNKLQYENHREVLNLLGRDSQEAKIMVEREEKFNNQEVVKKTYQIFNCQSYYEISLPEVSFKDRWDNDTGEDVIATSSGEIELRRRMADNGTSVTYTVNFKGKQVASFKGTLFQGEYTDEQVESSIRNNRPEIKTYFPGEWESALDSLYQRSLAKMREESESDNKTELDNLKQKVHMDFTRAEKYN